jgi:hypothetical protein
MSGTPSSSSSRPLAVILGLVALVGLAIAAASFLVVAGVIAALLTQAGQAPKTWYADCEQLSSEDCTECCRAHGHDGSASGELLNEGGRTCGCL